jgi:hypothetical protein
MTARTLTYAGWMVLAAAAVALELRARLRTGRLASLGDALALAIRVRFVRLAVLAAWAWVGWHLFAR